MSVIGLRVGPFEVESEVAVPEPGRWYRAVRTGLTRKQPAEALVRVLGPEATPAERQELQRAFENLRTLDDARVPAPIAYYEGIGALAVACVEGAPLDRLVEARATDALPMSPGTLLDIALELAETLQHAHHKGRWHGHLWPGVVLLGADGKLWVWGFGPGHESDPPEAWLPPERARGLAGTPALDQWSLGAFIASLITGKAPWSGADPRADARRGDPEGIVGPIESQWPALGRLLRKMLDPQPESRFPSLQPVRQDLLALARKAGGTSERHKLGGALAQRMLSKSAAAARTPAPVTRRPTPHAKDEIALTPVPAPTRATPPPAPRRDAPMAVVRPALEDDVPVAKLTPAPVPTRVVIAPRGDVTEERLATEIIDDDRAETEVIGPEHDLVERENTEMSEVSSLIHAVVEPVEEAIEDPISSSSESNVVLPEVDGLWAEPSQPNRKETPVAAATPETPKPALQHIVIGAADEEEDTGDAATEQWSADRLTTMLEDLDQPQTAAGRTPAPAPATRMPLPVAALQPTQPPQPPPLIAGKPIPVNVELDSSPGTRPTMVPVTDPGPASEADDLQLPPPHTGPRTDTGFGTDAGFFKGPSDVKVAPLDPPSGPGVLPSEPPPAPLPELKPALITKVAPILALLLLVALVLLTLWKLFG